jgi:hypothetical protein
VFLGGTQQINTGLATAICDHLEAKAEAAREEDHDAEITSYHPSSLG